MASADRLIAIFNEAKARPAGAERERFLADACPGDPELKEQVHSLLQAHQGVGDFLKDTLVLSPTALVTEKPGDTIGRYKLREALGEGGCGVVYVAEQEEPVRRRVALKVIKLGMDTKAVVARFEAERQALAMMDHPNIAKVLDAGTTDTGRPYFVMELVRGIKITDYCDQTRLGTKERLDLFIKVCQAIQHAHQKGIIHRDIKPSNILVTLHDGVAVPKVIDFGIAKATEGRLTDATVYTQLHQFIGTPAYMSPEQAEMSGLDIDTRSDIYSLGVLLYELLTGMTPFDANELMSQGIDVMRKTIREMEPVRPSTKLATLRGEEQTTTAKRHAVEMPRLIHQLQGDLDWVVMKCLEKDRTRRYETANGLALDLKRHLSHEPVVARPPSTAYRFQKLVRRNKVTFAAASAVVFALLCGLGLATVSLVRERLARAEADARRVEADTARKAETDQRQRAEQARVDEASQRQLAEANAAKARENEQHSRRLLYAADMNLAQQAVKLNNLGRARRLLERHRPASGEEDLRGWEWRYLWQQCQSDALAVLTRRPARGFSVSFSPDGSLLAVGYYDGRVELWDFPRKALLKVLQSEVGGGQAHVAFAPRTNLLAATGGRGIIKLHDLAGGQESILWQSPGRLVSDLSFSPDGTRLAAFTYAVGSPTAVVVIDIAQGQVLSTIATAGATAHLGAAKLSADRRRLYLSHASFQTRQLTIRCVNHETGQEIWSADAGLDFGIATMTLSPDEKVLVTASGYEDSTIRVWDAEAGKLLTKLEGHTGWIGELAFSHDGRFLASASADQSIRLWDASEWTEVTVFRGHGDEVHALAFSPDSRILASGGRDGAIMLWEVEARQSTRGHRLLPLAVKFATEAAPGIALTIDVQMRQAWILRLDDFTQSPVQFPSVSASHGLFFSPPNMFGIHDPANSLRIYEVRSPAPHLLGELVAGASIARGTWAHPGPIAYCPDKRLVAWGDPSAGVRIASLDQPAQRLNLNSDLNEPIPVEFSPDGRLLVLASRQGGNLEVREVASGKIVLKPEIQMAGGLTAFANEGRTLVAVHTDSSGYSVVFCDVAQPEKQPARFKERGFLGGLATSPDGRLVAVCSQDGLVVLYDAQTMERKRILYGHMQGAHGARFSPDGKSLVSSSTGREAVKLWHVETGQELLTLSGKGSLLNQVEFVDHGNALLAGGRGQQGTWQIWRAPSWEEITAAEAKEKMEIKQP